MGLHPMYESLGASKSPYRSPKLDSPESSFASPEINRRHRKEAVGLNPVHVLDGGAVGPKLGQRREFRA